MTIDIDGVWYWFHTAEAIKWTNKGSVASAIRLEGASQQGMAR
jgi:hypothetical protein